MSSIPFLSTYWTEWGMGRSDIYAIIHLLSSGCPFKSVHQSASPFLG